jgi:hypothetical protein
MPTRIIRGELNASGSLSRVSLEAELLFRALLLEVDDYGRLDARLEILKGRACPLRSELDLEAIREALAELATCDPGGAGPLELYEIGGRPYLAVRNWERDRGKGRRARVSKYPPPPVAAAGEQQLTFHDERRRNVSREVDAALAARGRVVPLTRVS